MNEPIKPVGRTLAEFQPLKPAERTVLDACRQGVVAEIAGQRPDMATEFNTVRAAFVRFLALGGDEQAPVHDHGVELQGACIEGVLDLRSAQIPVGLLLRSSHFTHVPDLRDSHIRGTLNLSGSAVPGLECDHAIVDGGFYLRDGFVATGTVRLLGANIGGNLNCSGARFESHGGDSLLCDRVTVKGSALLGHGLTANGKVRLLGARIGGDLDCDGAVLTGNDGDALLADRIAVSRSVFLGNGFTAHGRMRLLGAHIDGDLVCDGARLDGNDKAALQCDRMTVGQSVFLRNGFFAKGEIGLSGVSVRGDFVCDGSRIDGRGGTALVCDQMRVQGNVLLANGFVANGTVRFDNARVAGNFSCTGADFHDRSGESLSCESAVVEGTFFFRGLRAPVHGINLRSMRTRVLADDDKSWGERLVLDGFTYELISDAAPFSAASRIAWLGKQPTAEKNGDPFKRQPWYQLIRVLRAMNRTADASQVAIELEHRLYRAGLIGSTPQHGNPLCAQTHRVFSRLGHRLFWLFCGYGYRPLRLLGWMFAVWIVSAGIYWYAAFEGVVGPTDPQVFQTAEYRKCATNDVGNWYLCKALPEEYPAFSPLAYSLDLLVPFANLQQDAHWAVLVQAPHAAWYQELLAVGDLKHVTRLVVWFEILFGWASGLLLVAIVCGVHARSKGPPC